ncbi:MAG: hypothetical protein AAFN77_10945 [Planctomycetota bacterium]
MTIRPSALHSTCAVPALACLVLLLYPALVHAFQKQPTKPAVELQQETDQLATSADWKPTTVDEIKSSIETWIASSNIDTDQAEMLRRQLQSNLELPPSARPTNIDLVVSAIALVRPDVRAIADQLEQPRLSTVPPKFDRLLANPSESAFVKNHVRLLLGRWLSQNEFYDEALLELKQLDLDMVLDRKSLLFYRALVQHQLLEKDECIVSLELLLQHKDSLPSRYAVVSQMMLADVKPLQEDSLDQISRMMNDIRRRTGFNRSGKIVLREEQEVIDKLDKLIEQLEQQQQQQSQSQGPPSGGGSSPMEDSQNTNEKGSGKVAKKELRDGGNWGNLPPAKRAAALAEMAKDMPPHYRAAIEEYFRKLAKEDQ